VAWACKTLVSPLPSLFSHHLLFLFFCKGDPYLENSAQRMLGVEDFLCLGLARRGGGRFPLFFVYIPYLFGVNGCVDENKTNISTWMTAPLRSTLLPLQSALFW
jgi:hypothetical protein